MGGALTFLGGEGLGGGVGRTTLDLWRACVGYFQGGGKGAFLLLVEAWRQKKRSLVGVRYELGLVRWEA